MAAAGASVRHIAIGEIDFRVAFGIAVGGIPAVLVAAFIVKTMPVELLRWMVILVVLYAAAMMLRAAALDRRFSRMMLSTNPSNLTEDASSSQTATSVPR